MPFQHPALEDAVDGLVKLSAAAGVIGSPDPIEALRHIDCDPETITRITQNVARAIRPYREASYEFTEGLEVATREWEGEAKGQFLAKAGAIHRAHLNAENATRDLSFAGAKIAPHLDSLAKATASQSVAIAAQAEPACDRVLSGDFDDEAIEAVNNACVAVVKTVQAAVAEIPQAAQGF